MLETLRFPCFAIFKPQAAANIAAVVEIFMVPWMGRRGNSRSGAGEPGSQQPSWGFDIGFFDERGRVFSFRQNLPHLKGTPRALSEIRDVRGSQMDCCISGPPAIAVPHGDCRGCPCFCKQLILT